MRKLIYGVGINDLPFNIAYKSKEGLDFYCKIYRHWECMIKRCYGKWHSINRPSYKNVEVCDEWKLASNSYWLWGYI